MTLRKAGGLAALTCAATYLAGFAMIVTVFAPLGLGSDDIDTAAVVAFIAKRPGVMIANVAVEQTYALAADPEAAASLWQTLHAVELGLGGGNEIAGGAWILAVSRAGLANSIFGRLTAGIGAISGATGLVTILPPLGEVAGALFGLGAIAWFIAVGVALLRKGPRHVGQEVFA